MPGGAERERDAQHTERDERGVGDHQLEVGTAPAEYLPAEVERAVGDEEGRDQEVDPRSTKATEVAPARPFGFPLCGHVWVKPSCQVARDTGWRPRLGQTLHADPGIRKCRRYGPSDSRTPGSVSSIASARSAAIATASSTWTSGFSAWISATTSSSSMPSTSFTARASMM